VLVAAGLAAGLASSSALAEEGYRHGRVRFVESGVTLQRATEVSAEEAFANLPFLPGDRVWTDSAGRAEFQFPDGTLVRLDRRSKLDYAGHDEGQEERVVLRLWSGTAIVRVRSRDFARFEVETPAGMVQALDRAILRVDVEAGETRLSVYAGEAVLDDGRRQVRLAGGERVFARWGAEADEPERFEPGAEDDFALWDEQREQVADRWAARSSEYLPDELDPYAGEFESSGSWRYEGSEGYVWVPRVAVGWQPYSNGHWSWTPYGWTWVPYEPWGWVPSHYGNWGFSASLGWYWSPGRVWGPGWVSWAVGGGYVGWCPAGRHGRPVAPWRGHRGHAVPRGRPGAHDGWNVVRQGDLGARDVRRRRIGLEGIDPSALRVADSAALRPTRDARALREGDAVPRAISRRPTPGDFVRELGVDNKTTIPAPWTRGYGPPPAGVDGARYGVPRRTDGRDPGSDDGTRPSRSRTVPRPAPPATEGGASRATSSRGEGGARPAPSAGGGEREGGSVFGYRPRPGRTERTGGDEARSDQSRRRGNEGTSAERSEPRTRTRPRSDGWGEVFGGYRPRSGSEGSSADRSSGGGERSRAYRPRGGSSEGSGGDRPRSGGSESSGSYRPRSGSSESSSRSRPRSSGGESSGGYRPRGDGGSGGSGGSGGARPRAEGGASRPSRGGSGSGGGGGQAASRPRRDRS
jgi:hypothetical protein